MVARGFKHREWHMASGRMLSITETNYACLDDAKFDLSAGLIDYYEEVKEHSILDRFVLWFREMLTIKN